MGEQKLKKRKKFIAAMQLLSKRAPFTNGALRRQICTRAQRKTAGNHQAMGTEILTGSSLLHRQINSILIIVIVFKNNSCKLQLQNQFSNTLQYQNF